MAAAPEHYAHCEALLRERDRDLWLACLFVPQPARAHLHAIYAYAVEARDVRARVTQPLLGEMRLRWWVDAVTAQGELAQAARAHPVADALLDTLTRFDLPREEIAALAEAHVFDVYDDPMPTRAALEDYCRATVAAPMRWAARVLGAPTSDVFDDAGIALALTQILSRPAALPVFLPADLMAHGAQRRDAAAALLARADELFARARRAAAAMPAGREALLPAAAVPLYLEALKKRGDALDRAPAAPSPLRRQWRLWRASRSVGL